MQSAAVTWVAQVNNITARLKTSDSFVYLNHAGYFQKPLCATGSENLKYIRGVANKYDPQAVFQRLVPGGHKLVTTCGMWHDGRHSLGTELCLIARRLRTQETTVSAAILGTRGEKVRMAREGGNCKHRYSSAMNETFSYNSCMCRTTI
jgi:hypothetical protein